MAFFSSEVANIVQLFTFPMEVIGLTLATVEVRFPELAARIAGRLDRVASRIRDVEQVDQQKNQRLWGQIRRRQWRAAFREWFRHDASEDTTERYFEPVAPLFRLVGRVLGWLFRLLVVLVAVAIVLEILEITDPFALTALSVVVTSWVYLIGLAIILFIIWVALTVMAYFSISFVEGRAVGTLGIVIAGWGLLGEAYQFATQLIVQV